MRECGTRSCLSSALVAAVTRIQQAPCVSIVGVLIEVRRRGDSAAAASPLDGLWNFRTVALQNGGALPVKDETTAAC